MVGQLRELGAEARIEAEPAHGTYWWPLGIGAALGALGGIAAPARPAAARRRCSARSARPGSPPTSRPASAACAGCCRRRTTYNVVCELGARRRRADGGRSSPTTTPPTRASSSTPRSRSIADRLGLIESIDTSPPLMAPVIGGPLLAALGALTGSRLLSRLGVLLGLGSAAAMADIGARGVVPGANDNGSGGRRPARPRPTAGRASRRASMRVILLSVGSEESFSEGIKAFGERHFAELPRESTFFLSPRAGRLRPHLLVLRGEGFLKMREYPPRALALMDGLAEELGIWLYPNLRLHNGTDGLEPLAAGYETAVALRLQRPQAARRTTTGPTTSPSTSTSAPIADAHPPDRGGDPAPRRALALADRRLVS